MMSTIDPQKLEAICNQVWNDRAAVLEGRGFLSADAALARAVYWRLSKSSDSRTGNAENYERSQTLSTYRLAVNCLLELNAQTPFDCAPFLHDLIQRCQVEKAQNSEDKAERH